MKKITVIDSKEKEKEWKAFSEVITISEEIFNDDTDAFILSQDFLGNSLEEVMNMVKEIPVPAAVLTSDSSIENQEYLCSIGADDIICVPMCRKIMMRKIYSLISSVPNLADGKLIDFSVFNTIEESNGGHGAYNVNSSDFAGIYRFVLRLLERLDKSAQLLILTLSCETALDSDKEKIMKVLSNAVQICLRRGDISSEFGTNQVMVLLMGADDEGGHIVANRIVSNFYSECDDDSYKLSYDIRDIKP